MNIQNSLTGYIPIGSEKKGRVAYDNFATYSFSSSTK